MLAISPAQKELIVSKNELLEHARQQLKREFVGIDRVIDQVVDMLRAWYVFPDYQQRPTLINLWGMTGVGKTSLVKRLCELLFIEKSLLTYDMGNAVSASWDFQDQLRDIISPGEVKPLVFMFDEFQHVKSLNSVGEELDRPASRVIWDILDSGTITYHSASHWITDLRDLIFLLRSALRLGVKVVKGQVVDKREAYLQILSDTGHFYSSRHKSKEEDDTKSDTLFFPTSSYGSVIVGIFPDRFPTWTEFHQVLIQMNGSETIAFLERLLDEALAPKKLDCSKSLIFILGNLDEAYAMSHNISVDEDPDYLHERSLRIQLPDIKRALLKRFRPEQLSRLGSNHIIYPAFSKNSYLALIKLQLGRIADFWEGNVGLALLFDQSLHDLLYSEGVIPSQGSRPLFSVISNVVEARLPKFITQVILQKLECDSLHLFVKGEELLVQVLFQGKVLLSLEEKVELTVEKLRQAKRNDNQAIIAVHESGHAVVHMCLTKELPERIVSVAVDSNVGGFVFVKPSERYSSKQELLDLLSIKLAGYAAEILIFGNERMTSGAKGDFMEATELANKLVKEWGMGTRIGSFQVSDAATNDFLFVDDSIAKEVELLLQQAVLRANEMLTQHHTLLVKMADYLSDSAFMNKKLIGEFTAEFSSIELNHSTDPGGKDFSYRERVKNL